MSKKHILTPNRLIYKTILGLCMLEFWFSGLFSRKSNGLNRDFMNLFYLKETEELLNVKRHFRNFWVLVIIMTITFLAIGFSNGSLYYLGKKMNDPYVNFVNVVVPSGREGEAEMIIDSINLNNSMKGTYNISNATGFSFYYMDFMDTLNDKKRVFAGRTIDLSDPLLPQILDESSNLVSGKRAFNGEQDLGLIVDTALLRSMNYPLDAKFIYVRIPDENGFLANVPIPIASVVKSLPKDTEAPIDFLSTYYMYRNIGAKIEKTLPFSPTNTHSLVIHINSADSLRAMQVLDTAIFAIWNHPELLNGHEIPYFEFIVDALYPEKYTYLDKRTWTIKFDFSDTVSYRNIEKIYNNLISHSSFQPFKDSLTQLFYQPLSSYESIMAVPVPLHRISVHFNKLDKIEEFIDDIIAEKHGFPSPDIAQIKAKKNFNYISKLTYGISIILLFFSIFSIISYLSNLLKSHLEKIKPTIGTFMAFGTPGLGKIFLVLMTVFIVFPMILSLCFATILGNIGYILGLMKFIIPSMANYSHIGLIYGIMKLMIPSLEKFTYFDLFAYGDSWILTSSGILLILLLSYWMFRRTINRIFRETPGNLIFGRA